MRWVHLPASIKTHFNSANPIYSHERAGETLPKNLQLMYIFSTKEGQDLLTEFSPRQITTSRWQCFDAFDLRGNRQVVETNSVDFSSFEYVG